MVNQIINQSKSNQKGKAVASLIVGIISFINGVVVLYLPMIISGPDKPFPPVVVKYIYTETKYFFQQLLY